MSVQIVFGEGFESQQNQATGSGAMNALINPTTAFALPVVPSALSFAAGVLTENISFEKQHDLQFTILEKSTGSVVNDINGKSPIQNMNPLKTFNFNLNFRNVLFREEGEYELVFKIDGQEQGKQSFRIVHVAQ